MKISIRLFIITIGMLLLLQVPVLAATGKSTATNVRVRKTASTESEVIELLGIDDVVEILGQEGDWYKVNFKGTIGYVSQSFISTNEKIEDNKQEENKTEENNTQNVDNTQNANNVEEPKKEENTDNNSANEKAEEIIALAKNDAQAILDKAKEERAAGKSVNVVVMKKNKKFQKDQMAEEGYTEFVEFFKDKEI